jgi:hypothetical protein
MPRGRPKDGSKNPGGRPEKEIVKQSFESLCQLQCTEEEICAVLDVTDKTLTNWCRKTYNLSFSEIFAIKRESGKASLRRTQWKMAETNPTMALWLGKQYLGQKDKHDIDQNVANKDDKPFKVSIEVIE